MTAQSSNIAASYWTFKDLDIPSEGNSIEYQLKQKVENLIISIKGLLADKKVDVEESFKHLFDDILSLRFESLNWIKEKNLDVEELFDSIYENFDNRDIPRKYEVLNENVLFAIRTTSKIAENIFSSEDSSHIIHALNEFNNLSDSSEKNSMADSPYVNLVKGIKLISQQLPNNSLLQLIELINNSLIAELGIISADIIFDNYHELKVSKSKIRKLNELIVAASQEYGALSIELGLIKRNEKKSKELNIDSIDNEDQYLAELGLKEFFDNIDSND